jgi:YfiH family protein
MIKNSEYPNLLQFELFNRHKDALFHFTTTIVGGVSGGNYATFNLGLYSGDDTECVKENRHRLANILEIGESHLITPYQVHGDKILIIGSDFLSKPDTEQSSLLHGVDAVITNQKGICIGVGTADCVPVILFDPILKVFAAVHAGWRGTVAKIVEKTIGEMGVVFGCEPANILAGIGPSISQEHFEVGDEVVEAFSNAGFMVGSIGYKNIDTQKVHLDLSFANELLLTRAGILLKNTETANLCTYSNPSLFFSARRQGINSGRMISGGMIL